MTIIYDETRTVPLRRGVRLVGGDTLPTGLEMYPQTLITHSFSRTTYVLCVTPEGRVVTVGLDDFTVEGQSWLTATMPTSEED